jgi:hypothetical protein
MALRISESLRSEVRQAWLQPLSRNKVAAKLGISPASVSGIIDDWKRSIGVTLAEQLRDLAMAIDRHGISITQCAEGCRIAILLNNMGIDEDKLEAFLVETYNRCVGIGISPEDVGSHIQDLVSFAVDSQNLGIRIDKSGGEEGDYGGEDGNDNDDKNNGDDDDDNVHSTFRPIPSILQIAKYLERKKEENKKLDLKNKQLKNDIELLEAKKSMIMQQTEEELKKHHMTAEKLDRYMEMKTELLASGHSENDFALVLGGIKLVKENGNDFLEIASLFSEYKKLKLTVGHLQTQYSFLEGKIARLEETARISEEAIESKSQLQWHMVELEKMGFNLKRLRRLYNIVKEISEANGFSDADGYAVKVFLGQVEQYYDDLIGFEKKVSELREELQNLNILRLAQLNIISAQPYVGSALIRLLNRGLQEDQIVKLANLLEMHPDMIQLFLQNRNANEVQQKKDDIKSAPSSPFSSFLLSPSFSYSISSPSHSPSPSASQQHHPQSPQTSTGLTVQKSSSTPLTEASSTAEADSTKNHQQTL